MLPASHHPVPFPCRRIKCWKKKARKEERPTYRQYLLDSPDPEIRTVILNGRGEDSKEEEDMLWVDGAEDECAVWDVNEERIERAGIRGKTLAPLSNGLVCYSPRVGFSRRLETKCDVGLFLQEIKISISEGYLINNDLGEKARVTVEWDD